MSEAAISDLDRAWAGTASSSVKPKASEPSAPASSGTSSGGGGAAPSSTSSTTRSVPNASRKVVGLMAFAVLFSVIGEEIKAVKATNSKTAPGTFTGPAKIILGGTIATAILSFAAETGSTGQQFAVGLAAVTAGTAMLIEGGPVWSLLNKFFGSTPTGSTTNANTGQSPQTGATPR